MNYPFKKIKEHYEFLTPLIIARQNTHIRAWVNPYTEFLEWGHIFSPIEEQTWQAIRCFGKAPFYPQYPVGRYFVDFGNPHIKVAIECDGAKWHQDKEKDKNRDLELKKMGWKVYRISGSDCVRSINAYYDIDYLNENEAEEILSSFYSSSIEGLIKAIAIKHFKFDEFNDELGELEMANKCLKSRVLV